MGYIVPAACQVRKIGSPTQKAVLMALASYAWDDGSKIWVSKGTIAADLELGHRTVQDAIKALIEKGLLVLVGQREVKHGFTIEYRIDLDVVSTLPLTRDPKKKHFKDGCGSRIGNENVSINSPKNGCGSRMGSKQTGAGDCTDGCGSRTQLSKEYIKATSAGACASEASAPSSQAELKAEQQQFSKSGISEGFWVDLLKTIGVNLDAPGKWWEGDQAKLHVARWFEAGLTEDQILAVARKSRDSHAEPPHGPKGLDKAMKAAAEAPAASAPATPADQVNFWAEKLNAGKFVAPSAISVGLAKAMLAAKAVTEATLRQRGIAF